MKSSLQVSLSSAMKTSFLSFSALFLVLSVFGGNAFAGTPIAVDMYQDMESGNAGDVLTTAVMNASAHPSSGWSVVSGTMWVATNYHRDLPYPITVGGVTYNGTGGSRSWKFNNDNLMNSVRFGTSAHSLTTVGLYYTTLTTLQSQVGYDTIVLWGNSSFACMQTLGGPVFRQHSGGGGQSTAAFAVLDGPNAYISATTGKTYWINMKYDGPVAQVHYAVFDPDNGYAQVGSTLFCQSTYNDDGAAHANDFGRADQHGNQSNESTQSYFDHIMFDWTNGAFPLLPSGYNDTTAPGAPPVVRDGTGTDQSIALSTTQLSANWDMAWDAQSGIKAYQYAIGTSQGGTDVVNWTTIRDQLGITKTGLSLTTGRTYYFSVKAINGVGLTGTATNSNGQTVGTDATAPSAPAAVRDASLAAGGVYNFGYDIDATGDNHDMYCNFDPAVDNESGISFYQVGVGTTPGATDAVAWKTVQGNFVNGWASTINPPNGLTTGVRYYYTVRAVNNAGIAGPAANSDGQIAINGSDTTPPSAPPAVRDGTGADISTTTSTTQLSVNWDRANDNESGIISYDYAIGTTVGGTNVVGWTTVPYDGPVTTVTRTGLSLSVGQTYYFTVKARNGKWIVGSAANSNGQTVVSGGNQPPSAPANVRDGVGADIAYTTSTTQLSANWDASTDSDGSVTAYQYAIGTSAGGTQAVNWTTLGNVTTVTKTSLSLTSGQTYYFSVKAVDNQGLAGNATNSNGQTVDTTAPGAPGAVRDGTGADIVYTGSTTQLSANWDAAVDAESGISGYQYAIGTTAGGTQTVNWTSLGNVLTVTKTGLTLSNGQTYFFSVQAVNGAGSTGSATNSNGQKVDTTAAVAPPTVRDGTGADISTTSSTTQLSANWDASTDNESGISGYQYAIGTSAGGTQTVNWTSLGNVTTVTKTGLTLTNGQTYFFSVQAVNGAGVTGSAMNSNGQTVQTTDITPPSAPPAVRDGIGADISTTSSTTQLSANWDASTDNESGISGYQYAIGTTAGGTQTVNWTSLGNVTTVTKTGLTLSVGQTYFFSVKAVNGAGLTGSATNSNGQTVVSGGSSATPVDAYQDMESGNNNDVLTATLMNTSSHPSGSGWSTGAGTMWVSTSHHNDLPGPVVCGGVTYNGTGGTRAWVYNNNNIANYVKYSGAGHSKITVAFYYTTNMTIQNLVAAYDPIEMYGSSGTYLCFQLTNGDGAGPYLRLAGNDSTGGHSSPNVTITSGKTYWANVKYDSAAYMSSLAVFDPANSFAQVGTTVTVSSGADTMYTVWFGRCDNYGNASNDATQSWFDQVLFDWTNAALPLIPSAGTDSTPPSAPPAVRDGTGTDISTTSSTTQLSANWDASTDNESGISGYQYAIGTSAGGTQTVNWTSLGNVTTVTKTGLTLSVGQTYYFSVKAVNGAGLTGSATNSNGQTVVSSATTYFSDNFENWTVHGGAWSSVSGETATQTQNTSTDYARAGTKSLKLTDNDTTNTYGACLVKNFSPTISNGIYVRFYVYLPSAYVSANNGAASRRLLRVFCQSNRGQMSLYLGARPMMEEVGAWGASTDPSSLSSDAWHCIEMYMATPSASTAMQYWVDGTSTGTLNGSFSGSTAYNRIEFGNVSVGGGTNALGTFYLDEVIVSDTYNGLLP